AAPDYGQLVRIECSNGGYVGFVYNTSGYITEAYTSDGRRVIYEYDSFGDLVQVNLPGLQEVRYDYNHYAYTKKGTSYFDSFHALVRETKPGGRVLQNIYDRQRRVV